jgi:hypothetical protein
MGVGRGGRELAELVGGGIVEADLVGADGGVPDAPPGIGDDAMGGGVGGGDGALDQYSGQCPVSSGQQGGSGR